MMIRKLSGAIGVLVMAGEMLTPGVPARRPLL